MHMRIAAYQAILATASHTVLGRAVSNIAQARSQLGPEAEPFLTSLMNSLFDYFISIASVEELYYLY